MDSNNATALPHFMLLRGAPPSSPCSNIHRQRCARRRQCPLPPHVTPASPSPRLGTQSSPSSKMPMNSNFLGLQRGITDLASAPAPRNHARPTSKAQPSPSPTPASSEPSSPAHHQPTQRSHHGASANYQAAHVLTDKDGADSSPSASRVHLTLATTTASSTALSPTNSWSCKKRPWKPERRSRLAIGPLSFVIPSDRGPRNGRFLRVLGWGSQGPLSRNTFAGWQGFLG